MRDVVRSCCWPLSSLEVDDGVLGSTAPGIYARPSASDKQRKQTCQWGPSRTLNYSSRCAPEIACSSTLGRWTIRSLTVGVLERLPFRAIPPSLARIYDDERTGGLPTSLRVTTVSIITNPRHFCTLGAVCMVRLQTWPMRRNPNYTTYPYLRVLGLIEVPGCFAPWPCLQSRERKTDIDP